MDKKKNKKTFVVIIVILVLVVASFFVFLNFFAPSYHSRSSCYNISSSIKANLDDLRAGGELYYDNHNKTYEGFCGSNFINEAQKNILEKCSREDIEKITCNDSSQAWCAYSSELTATKYSNGIFCVDSRGSSGELPASQGGCDQNFSCKSE